MGRSAMIPPPFPERVVQFVKFVLVKRKEKEEVEEFRLPIWMAAPPVKDVSVEEEEEEEEESLKLVKVQEVEMKEAPAFWIETMGWVSVI